VVIYVSRSVEEVSVQGESRLPSFGRFLSVPTKPSNSFRKGVALGARLSSLHNFIGTRRSSQNKEITTLVVA
jgi:hypothetical protein